MIFILIGMLQCSKLSYDFYNSKHYRSRLDKNHLKVRTKCLYKEKKCVARGQEGKLYQNTLNELSKYYTNADMNIICDSVVIIIVFQYW